MMPDPREWFDRRELDPSEADSPEPVCPECELELWALRCDTCRKCVTCFCECPTAPDLPEVTP